MKHERAEAVGVGIKTGGKIDWDDQRAFTDELRQMPDGVVVVTVEQATPGAIRSLQSNKYLWAVVYRLIADYTEQPKDDIHDFYCSLFLTRTVSLVNRQTGEVEEREVSGRSSKLSPTKFVDFVENVRLDASERFGLEIPDPDPRWRERETRPDNHLGSVGGE